MSTIRVEELVRRFRGDARPAVDRVSFEAGEGELVVLLGPSGSGKTTLLKMVNRLYEPTSGAIFIDGVNALEIPRTTLRRSIGYVIQQTGLFPHLTVADNIATVPRLLGWQKARIRARVDELLELVRLPVAYRNRYPRQLSGGEQQRVGIARALAADPGTMLMDEPFGALDAITRASLQDELLAIQRRVAKTILFVTHDVEEALRLADRILVLCEGRVEQFAPPLEILTRPASAFVAQLVDAHDMLRRLRFLRAKDALQPLDGSSPARVTIPWHRDLRAALSDLLACQEEALTVVDEEGQPLGLLTFATLRRAIHPEHSVA